MEKNVKIAPSMLSADFSKMGEELARVENAGADIIHLDVMDGVFVPNITFGIKMVADLKKIATKPLDCHLMIVSPEKYVKKFAEAGADYVKTSTGFSTGGADAHDVELMRKTVGDSMGVKASGGIRDKETAEKMVKAGASRLGTSATVAICK